MSGITGAPDRAALQARTRAGTGRARSRLSHVCQAEGCTSVVGWRRSLAESTEPLVARMDEIQRLGEPLPALPIQVWPHGREVVFILWTRSLGLEEQHDFWSRVRDARSALLNQLIVGELDACVAAADPLVVDRWLAKDIQSPIAGFSLTYPRLMPGVRVTSGLSEGHGIAIANGKEVAVWQTCSHRIELVARHRNLEVIVDTSLIAKEQIDRPARSNAPGNLHATEAPSNLVWPPGMPPSDIWLEGCGK